MNEKNQIDKPQNKKIKVSVYKPQSPFERLRLSCKNPHEALYKAILLQAVIDASGFYLQKYKSNKKNFKAYREAYYWIFDSKSSRSREMVKGHWDETSEKDDLIHQENSFEDICQKAGLGIRKTIEAVESIVKKHNKTFDYISFIE
jgi:hypothetical protein